MHTASTQVPAVSLHMPTIVGRMIGSVVTVSAFKMFLSGVEINVLVHLQKNETYLSQTRKREDNTVSRWCNGSARLQQWLMLSARTWVRVPPRTSGVFQLLQGFFTQQSNPKATICAMCPIN